MEWNPPSRCVALSRDYCPLPRSCGLSSSTATSHSFASLVPRTRRKIHPVSISSPSPALCLRFTCPWDSRQLSDSARPCQQRVPREGSENGCAGIGDVSVFLFGWGTRSFPRASRRLLQRSLVGLRRIDSRCSVALGECLTSTFTDSCILPLGQVTMNGISLLLTRCVAKLEVR